MQNVVFALSPPPKISKIIPYCEISDRAQMSKTIIAVRYFGLGGRELLETAVDDVLWTILSTYMQLLKRNLQL